ncbi:MAG: TRAP transporter large permease [Candidatus Adiutrix sp.]|jgi:C4-dicarboxylate transporter DctM subunit|nr:TRAP transporter large permease [Candidatus Adiutrix sp.]
MMLLLLFGSFFVMLALGVPIVFSLALSAAAYFMANGIPMMQLITKLVAGVDSFTILAIPFFLLAGDLMSNGGISRRMLRFASALVGHLSGGIAVTGVVSCAMFGSICGSAPATAASIGSIVVPEMKRTGYRDGFTGAIMSASGLLGVVIPPSIVMVMFGATAGISIGSLFIGGIIPGLLFAGGLAAYSIYQSRKRNYGVLADGSRVSFSGKELRDSFIDAILPLTTPLFIMGSIMFGIATATEAAVISVVWSLFLALVIYREITVRQTATIFIESVARSGRIIGMMGASVAFSYAMTVENVPATMAAFFVQYINSEIGFFLITLLIVFVLGCFLETIAIIVMVTPILLPIALAMNIEPLHFGMFMCMALTSSGITPPVGLCLITTCQIVGVKIEETFPELFHCIGIELAVTFLVMFFPAIATWLPSVFM